MECYILIDNCRTCKKLPECENHLREVWGERYDDLSKEFSCDFYRRKNSGAFRRKVRKIKKEVKNGKNTTR